MNTPGKKKLIEKLKEKGYLGPEREIDTQEPTKRVLKELDKLNKEIHKNEAQIESLYTKILQEKVSK